MLTERLKLKNVRGDLLLAGGEFARKDTLNLQFSGFFPMGAKGLKSLQRRPPLSLTHIYLMAYLHEVGARYSKRVGLPIRSRFRRACATRPSTDVLTVSGVMKLRWHTEYRKREKSNALQLLWDLQMPFPSDR